MPIMAAATQRPSESVDTNGVVTFVWSAQYRDICLKCLRSIYLSVFFYVSRFPRTVSS